MFNNNEIYNIDALIGLKELDDSSIDMIITSPPYDNLRNYDKGSSFDFYSIAKECFRVLKDNSVLIWNVSDATINGSESLTSFKQAIYFVDECGFKLYDTMLYVKKNYVPLTHRRYEQCFEYIFCFSKGVPKTFNPIMIKTLNQGKTKDYSKKIKSKIDKNSMRCKDSILLVKDTKIKSNIFEYSVGTEKDKDETKIHPAIFPIQLAKDQIVTWSNEQDLILDIFMGSGTTAKACFELNRNYIGFDISKKYVELANKRIERCNLKLF